MARKEPHPSTPTAFLGFSHAFQVPPYALKFLVSPPHPLRSLHVELGLVPPSQSDPKEAEGGL